MSTSQLPVTFDLCFRLPDYSDKPFYPAISTRTLRLSSFGKACQCSWLVSRTRTSGSTPLPLGCAQRRQRRILSSCFALWLMLSVKLLDNNGGHKCWSPTVMLPSRMAIVEHVAHCSVASTVERTISALLRSALNLPWAMKEYIVG